MLRPKPQEQGEEICATGGEEVTVPLPIAPVRGVLLQTSFLFMYGLPGPCITLLFAYMSLCVCVYGCARVRVFVFVCV